MSDWKGLFTGRDRPLFQAFKSHVTGESAISGKTEAKRFLEACDKFAARKSPALLVESIFTSKKGIEALSTVVRSDTSNDFLESIMTLFILHLSDPQAKTLANGDIVKRIVIAVVNPPTFWYALLSYYQDDKFRRSSTKQFAWLCKEIVSTRADELAIHHLQVAEIMKDDVLIKSSCIDVRQIAYRIAKVIRTHTTTTSQDIEYSPGGRHDNDFVDFRDIALLPTSDEIQTTQQPFLPLLNEVFKSSPASRSARYLEWLFRLLREDMLADLRDSLAIAWGNKKGFRKPFSLSQLSLTDHDALGSKWINSFSLALHCYQPLFPPKMSNKDKEHFLNDSKGFLKHGSLGVLCHNADIVAFGSILRDVHLLVKDPPVIVIKFPTVLALKAAITAFMGEKRHELKYLSVDTPVFAYEPILERLKTISELPLEETLLDPKTALSTYDPPENLVSLIETLKECLSKGQEVDFCRPLKQQRSILVSGAQLESLINGLESAIGQVQGPPGTGKSFVGALIAQIILKWTGHRILVLSFTNHALDQFLEDLLDIGVSEADIVRLGSKFTARTANSRLEVRARDPRYKFSSAINTKIRSLKEQIAESDIRMKELSRKICLKQTPWDDILEALEFTDDEPFWRELQIPVDDGFQSVGVKNKPLQPKDLLKKWARGENQMLLTRPDPWADDSSCSLWTMSMEERQAKLCQWTRRVREEQMDEYAEIAESMKELRGQIDNLYNESKRKVLQSQRVIGCTTTGAAMYQSLIEAAEPDVVLVEEAGEILEAHIITALGPSVKKLVLIGDHKQLRPKINNYNLSIEKGAGFDLDVSLFERLIQQGHTYTTLREQHRSHPEISYFTRLLSYEKLKDNAKTLERSPIRGIDKRFVFVHHEHPEEKPHRATEVGDASSKTSKRNAFEADMVIRTVKYLSQQGFLTENMVVLTPYLGQLSLLRNKLSAEHDPQLNDPDTNELVRAGLMTAAASAVDRKRIRLSTIDNYQGEESDVVIASLTRSNNMGDIGFMHARERLTVLISRAREGIIMFGNMHTFMASKKGGDLWKEFLKAVRDKECIFDGVPVHCERHADQKAILKSPSDFDKHCPDGGCTKKCDAMLSCGKHICPRRCHRVEDHSRTACDRVVENICERGHKTKRSCRNNDESRCWTCVSQDAETRRRVTRDIELERARRKQQDAYAAEREGIEDEIDRVRRTMAFEEAAKVQEEDLTARKAQLKTLQKTQERRQAIKDASARAKVNQDKETSSCPGQKSKNNSNSNSNSKAVQEWELLKAQGEPDNDVLDELMGMIGLEAIKEEFLSVKSTVDVKIQQGVALSSERLSCSLLGNPGTGKTTVARLWGKFLSQIGALPGICFKETTGSKLANGGVSGCDKLLEEIKDEGGGVLFIDEAYQLSSGAAPGGKAVLDYLLAEVENLRGKVSFVIAGYSKEMESFFSHNPGIPSRFPIEMQFADYTDQELLEILQSKVETKFKGRMKIEDGPDGLYFRIASRRIGGGRGKPGFGNARAVENALAQMEKRQAGRLRKERQSKDKAVSDGCFLSKQDIIGPEPYASLATCGAWAKLNKMFGLQEVKKEVKILLDSIITNYHRELNEVPPLTFSLNRVFIGSPGTGKTTVAKLYGQILAALGLLSTGQVVVKTPADFIGSYTGHSEAQTKSILASTVGKVLVIDEAYGFYSGGSESGAVTDPYRTAAIDTIVAEVQNVPGDDRCVILLGYKEQMETMFQNVNPGLSRRFSVDSPFVFHDFDINALQSILDLKLKESGLRATGEAKGVAMEMLARERNRPNFGNAGAIDNLLSKAKRGYQQRVSDGTASAGPSGCWLEAIDFDDEFDRASKASTNIRQLFADEVGRENIVARLEYIQDRVRQLRSLKMDVSDEIPFNFVFRGPPGTGKTTTARKMGKVYFDLGFLSAASVEECSATHLIGQYVGQTGPKVQKMLDRALGRVLFIDEAYCLAGPGPFTKEAIDELVDCVTKERYAGKLIIILAGYDDDMNKLLDVNPGLSSRFPETVDFAPLTPESCLNLLTKLQEKKKSELESKGKEFDISCLQSASEGFKEELFGLFRHLTAAKGWANARDVKQLSKSLFRKVDISQDNVRLEEEQVRLELESMLTERRGREKSINKAAVQLPQAAFTNLWRQLQKQQEQQSTTTITTTQKDEGYFEKERQEKKDDDDEDDGFGTTNTTVQPCVGIRDANVSDEVWEQLQRDAAEERRREETYQALKRAERRAAGDAARERIVKLILEEDARRKKEAAAKARLEAMGCCPVGYHWIKQNGGYRCAGGSHWMLDEEIRSE